MKLNLLGGCGWDESSGSIYHEVQVVGATKKRIPGLWGSENRPCLPTYYLFNFSLILLTLIERYHSSGNNAFNRIEKFQPIQTLLLFLFKDCSMLFYT